MPLPVVGIYQKLLPKTNCSEQEIAIDSPQIKNYIMSKCS